MKKVSVSSKLELNDVQVKIQTKTILDGISAFATGGNLLAVMGATGSGKSTLLNAIAGRIPISSGVITLDGLPYTKLSRRRLAYVMQHDIFLPNLTLWETLYFTAMIRLTEDLSQKEKLIRIEEIVDILSLRKCLNTVIGGIFVPGLSGGEKKRANIACELLMDSDILLIDEPTSGLDSSIAHALMVQLRNYATDYNKTIIATIHQPSSQMYHMFSTLLLLVNGQGAYFGNAHEALNHFEKIGLFCEAHFNPADFLLNSLNSSQGTIDKIVSAAKQASSAIVTEFGIATDFRQKFLSIERIDNLWSPRGPDKSEKNMITEDNLKNMSIITRGSTSCIETMNADVICVSYRKTGDVTLNPNGSTVGLVVKEKSQPQRKWATSFCTQCRLLTWRNFKQAKGRTLDLYEVLHVLICGILTGILYYQIEHSVDTIRDRMGLIFFPVVFFGFNIGLKTVAVFQMEKGVVCKERSAGAYRLSAYYIAKMTSELPLIIIMPAMLSTILYWMSGLSTVHNFFQCLAIQLVHCLISQSVATVVGASISSLKISLIACTNIMVVSFMYGGFFTQHFPLWLSWAKYLSFMHYPFGAVSMLVFKDMEPVPCNVSSIASHIYQKCDGNSTELLTGSDILQHAGVNLPIYCYLSSMGIIFIILEIVGYYTLRLKRN